jgi:Bacterial SH3 domain/Transglycosylase SLT domain
VRVTPRPRQAWADVIPRDHRAEAEMLHLDGNSSACASLPSGRRGRKSRVALLILILLFELSSVALPALAQVPSRSAAAITETRIRAAPDRRAEPLLRLPEGATVTVHGKAENGWYRVRHGQLEGYVLTGDLATEPVISAGNGQSGEALEESNVVALEQRAGGRAREPRNGQTRDDPPRDSGEVITATDLNLRQSPSQDAPVTAVMPRGEQVVPTGEQSDGFVEVRWQETTGWVFGQHLVAPRRATVRSDRDPTSWGRRELIDIIYEAADRYRQSREDMLRVARCESNLVPTAVNARGGSYGLFQFKPGTWLGTPFAEYDIFDPRANAHAAAWMWSQGRRREWVCQ